LNFIFKYYGEIRKCKKVTDAIINFRKKHEINTTTQLVEIIKSALPPKQLHIKKHPARNYFQAIRIAVNDELNKLKLFLSKAFGLLNKYGRLVIITFHSLEDRIVKQAFIKKTTMRIPKEVPVLSEQIDYLLITKHPIIANQEEVTINHRARSAKLRAIERK
jgi:16S rRNA (cytosine1402-N4)-methyltransferase